MPRTRIKICGVRDIEAAVAAADAGADAIGLVFVESSPRHVDWKRAAEIAKILPPFVEAVGLFVDTPPAAVAEVCLAVGLKTVQLHGPESVDEGKSLRSLGLKVIKGLPFTFEGYAPLMDDWSVEAADAVLWDAPPRTPSEPSGGTGRTLDWRMIAELYDPEEVLAPPPMILAGGLTPENVGEAISIVRPFAVDVSSGVEKRRGVKDAKLIHAFCDAVREADAEMEHEARRKQRG